MKRIAIKSNNILTKLFVFPFTLHDSIEFDFSRGSDIYRYADGGIPVFAIPILFYISIIPTSWH